MSDTIAGIDIIDRPIAFNREFVKLGAGIAGALMLSQAVYWSKRTKDADGWFYKTQNEWEDETGLTRREQENARKVLVSTKILEEQKRGVPCKLYYRVNKKLLIDALSETYTKECKLNRNSDGTFQSAAIRQTGLPDNGKLVCHDTASLPAAIRQTITDNTQILPDTSSETISALPADDAKDVCKKIWGSYSSAYLNRYGVMPVRNAKTNALIRQLLHRLGVEAVDVAHFFVGIQDTFLIRGCHDLGLFVARAESYRTQWATGQAMNTKTASDIERKQNTANAVNEAMNIIMKREQGEVRSDA